MDCEDDKLRAELEAACETVRRAIDFQQRSQRTVYGNRADRAVLKALRNKLGQLEEALAGLGPRDAKAPEGGDSTP